MLAYHRFITLKRRGEDFDRKTGTVMEYCGWLYSTNIHIPLEKYVWVEKTSGEGHLLIFIVAFFILAGLGVKRWRS